MNTKVKKQQHEQKEYNRRTTASTAEVQQLK